MCHDKKFAAEGRIHRFIRHEYDPKIGIIKGSDSEKLLRKDLKTIFTKEILDKAIEDYSTPDSKFTQYGLCYYFLDCVSRKSCRCLLNWLGFNIDINYPYIYPSGDKKSRLELLIRAKKELYD